MFNGLKRPVGTIIFFFILFLLADFSTAQTRGIDSMRSLVKNGRMDTVNEKTMTWMSWCFYQREMYDSANKYAEKALILSDTLKFIRGKVSCYADLGTVAFDRGKYADALQYFLKEYQFANDIRFQKGISSAAINLGLVYYYTGDYPTALRYYLLALKIKEQLGDKITVATIYNNIIDVYKEEENYESALEYSVKLLKINSETQDSVRIGYAYTTLGEIYLKQGKLDSAMLEYNKANVLGGKIKNKIIQAYSGSGIGEVLLKKSAYDDAYTQFKDALQVADSIDDKEIISMIYYDLGQVNVKMHKFQDACNYYARSLFIAKRINDKKQIMQDYLALTNYDSVSGNLNAVLDHYKNYILYRDSIFSEQNARKIEYERLTYDNEEQQAITKVESDRNIQRQKILRDVFIGGFGIALLFSLVFFRQRLRIGKEKKRSDDLLLNILPAETAEELKENGSTVAKDYDMVTVLFTDFKNFTKTSENLNAQELVNEINYCYSEFDRIVTRFGIEKIKTIGDGYMAAGGLPVKNTTNAIDALTAALAIRDFIEQEKQRRQSEGKPFFEIRIGMHTGHVVAGVVGIKKFAYDIWGDTVNIASRMESSGEVGKVNISGATYEFVKDQFKCTYRGKVQAKNKGEIDMYFVDGRV